MLQLTNGLRKARAFGSLSSILPTALVTFLLLQAVPAMAAQTAYRVTAGDVLAITVYGDNGLSGQFPVSGDGTIGYPILGNIAVADRTVGEISEEIGKTLMEHIANLSVAVAVKEYAPVFIMGEVQKPGKYEFRPGMITLELFALSGGLREATTQTDVSGVQLIAAQQEYEDMSLQILSQDIRRVRLEAELGNRAFEYQPSDGAPTRDPVLVRKMVDAERGIYQQRLSVMESQRRNLEEQRANYIDEIEMLEKSTVLRNEQFSLTQMDVNASQGLVTRGAIPEASLRERKKDLLAMNQQLLEAGSFLARAKQNKNEMDRQIDELVSRRQNDAAGELRDVNLDMIRLRNRMMFSVQTMAEIGAAARRVTTLNQTITTEFVLVRPSNGNYVEQVIDEHTVLKSGDLVRVRLRQAALQGTRISSAN